MNTLKTIQDKLNTPIGFILKVCVVYMALVFFLYGFGAHLQQAFYPLLKASIEFVGPYTVKNLELKTQDEVYFIEYEIQVSGERTHKNLTFYHDPNIVEGLYSSVFHIQFIIALTLVLVFPCNTRKKRLVYVGLCLLVLTPTVLMDMTIQTITDFERFFVDDYPNKHFYLAYKDFYHNGGRQIVAVFIALIVYAIVWIPELLKPLNVERNALCPCGSGRKFKNCCMQ